MASQVEPRESGERTTTPASSAAWPTRRSTPSPLPQANDASAPPTIVPNRRRVISDFILRLQTSDRLQTFESSIQREPALGHVGPEIAHGADAIRHRRQRERSRPDLAALDLFPRAG